jgi:hypothetical protein
VSTLAYGQRGLTLVEVALAAGIIAVGLAGLVATVPLSAYGIQEGSQLSTATFLAGQRLEQVRMAVWTATPPRDDLGLSPSADAPPAVDGITSFPDESPVAAPYTQYSRRVRVMDCGTGPGCAGVLADGLRQVTVTVSYAPLTGVGRSPSSKSAVLTLLLARR